MSLSRVAPSASPSRRGSRRRRLWEQGYIEEDKYLTAKKTRVMSLKARRNLPKAIRPRDIQELAESLTSKGEILERYPEI